MLLVLFIHVPPYWKGGMKKRDIRIYRSSKNYSYPISLLIAKVAPQEKQKLGHAFFRKRHLIFKKFTN